MKLGISDLKRLFVCFSNRRAYSVTYVQINTYPMKIYVLLHFEHKHDVAIIVKLLHRARCRR